MALTATVRKQGNVTVVDFQGRLVLGPASESLRTTVLGLFEKGTRSLLIGLEGITQMDSAGLGELVSIYGAFQRKGGAVKLLRPSRKVQNLLELTRLDVMFEVWNDENAAVSALQGGRPTG